MNTKDEFLDPVNLGNPNEFTMFELAKMVLKLTNSKTKLVYYEVPKDDPKQRLPNINSAKKELNRREPLTQLKEGLKKTIKYFESII
jgi:UDP-glucuronate decarboxylase